MNRLNFVLDRFQAGGTPTSMQPEQNRSGPARQMGTWATPLTLEIFYLLQPIGRKV
jgi:hypothetical protein